jgi:hypothetical protein
MKALTLGMRDDARMSSRFVLCAWAVVMFMGIAPGLTRADTKEFQQRLTARAQAKIRAHALAVVAASSTPEFIVEVDASKANAFRVQMESREEPDTPWLPPALGRNQGTSAPTHARRTPRAP